MKKNNKRVAIILFLCLAFSLIEPLNIFSKNVKAVEEKLVINNDNATIEDSPQIITIKKENDQINITWLQIGSENKYEIKIDNHIFKTSTNSFTYPILKRLNDTTVAVREYVDNGFSKWSEEKKINLEDDNKNVSKNVSNNIMLRDRALSSEVGITDTFPQYKVEVYRNVGDKNDWEEMYGGDWQQLNSKETPIQKIKVTNISKKDKSLLKYQVYVYDTVKKEGSWQNTKIEGEEAGEDNKVITSLRFWIEGSNYDVSYNVCSNLNDKSPLISSFVSRGEIPVDPTTNTKPIASFTFNVVQALPKINTQIFVNGKWINTSDKDFTGVSGTPLNMIKLSMDKKPTNSKLKYQVFIKENDAWQDWKEEGQAAGEEGKTITNLRAILDGNKDYDLRYNFRTITDSNEKYISSFGSNGKEGEGTNKNTKEIDGVYFEFCKGSPKLNIMTYGDCGGTSKEWSYGSDENGYGPGVKGINKFIINLSNKPKGTTIMYQVYSKLKKQWQDWKYEGQEAGIDNDEITNIRIKFVGETYGNGVKYMFTSSYNDNPMYVSKYGYDGKEPEGSLANNKSICSIYVFLYESTPISELDTSGSEIVIDHRYEIPEGTKLVIPAGKKVTFNSSKMDNPGFIVKGELDFVGNQNSKIDITDNSYGGYISVEKNGKLNFDYTNYIQKNKVNDVTENFILSNGYVNIKNSSFLGNEKSRYFLWTYGDKDCVIDNTTISKWVVGVDIGEQFTGNSSITNSVINENETGIYVRDSEGYAVNKKIDILNNKGINQNDTGIIVGRSGLQTLHKPLNIINNTIYLNNKNGVEFNCSNLSNINFYKNIIKDTVATKDVYGDTSILKGAPIFINISSITDTGDGSIKFINDINTNDATKANTIENNNIDGIFLRGTTLRVNLSLGQGKYKYILGNLIIGEGTVLQLDEGCEVSAIGYIRIKGELNSNGSEGKEVIISSFQNSKSPIPHKDIGIPSDYGYQIGIADGGKYKAISTKHFGGGLYQTSGSSKIYSATIYNLGETYLSKCEIDNLTNTKNDGFASDNDKVSITQCTISSCAIGLNLREKVTVLNSTITNNDTGIFARKGVTISNSIIKNSRYGVSSNSPTSIYDSDIIGNTYGINISYDKEKAEIGKNNESAILNCNIKNNSVGINYFATNGDPLCSINYNNISGNKYYGVSTNDEKITYIDAKYNYWGDKNGPTAYYMRNDYSGSHYVFEYHGDSAGNGKGGFFIPYCNEEIEGNKVIIDDTKVSEETYKLLNDYGYNLKKAMYNDEFNPGSGALNKKYDDLVVKSLGMDLNLSRMYSSRNTDKGILGEGWNFYYNSSIVNIKDKYPDIDTNAKIVTLPGGEVCVFEEGTDGKYKAGDTRNTLEFVNNQYKVKTLNGLTYIFSSDGKLIEIHSKEDNTLKFSYDTNVISKIVDQAGREYVFTYSNKLLTNIQEKINGANKRTIKYNYTNGMLLSVTDVNGNIQETYKYDENNKLHQILRDNKAIETIDYVKVDENDKEKEKGKGKISSLKDANDNVYSYTYDNLNNKVTVKDSHGKIIDMIYDSNLLLTSTVDNEGNSSRTEYKLDKDKNNILGEPTFYFDEKKNCTTFVRDDKGNITSEIRPGNSKKQYEYDDNNNLIKEIDEVGNKTFYVYDSKGQLLLEKIQPLNGVDEYINTSDKTKFAITKYEYYPISDTIKINGLVKNEIQPSGSKKSYTYDKYGNVITETNELGKASKYSYDDYSNRITEENQEAKTTKYKYNNKGKLIEKEDGENNITRYSYDKFDKVETEISPKDIGTNVTKTYSYYNTGLVKSIKDCYGNTTEYTYDVYGNKASEKNSLGGIHYFSYDALRHVLKEQYRESEGSELVTLRENEYSYEGNASNEYVIIQKTKEYIDKSAFKEVITKYDSRDNVLSKKTDNVSNVINTYNPNGTLANSIDENNAPTYYSYDIYGNVIKVYTPVKSENDNIKYKCQINEYNVDGVKVKEQVGLELVNRDEIPKNFYTKTYALDEAGQVKSMTDSEGRKIGYSYYNDGNVKEVYQYKNSIEYIKNQYTYNANGQVKKESKLTQKGDIAGNTITDTGEISLDTLYEYDKNGNLTLTSLSDGSKSEKQYDSLNRLKQEKKTTKNSSGEIKSYTESYDYLGDTKNIKTYTDSEKNYYKGEYSNDGLLKRKIYNDGSSIEYSYDLLKREVSNIKKDNYYPEGRKTLSLYDNVTDKVIVQAVSNEANGIKGYKYDTKGNLIKEVDGEQLNSAAGGNYKEKINNAIGKEYNYSLDGNLTSILNPDSKTKGKEYTKKYEYDVFNNKTVEVDSSGNKIQYKLNSYGSTLEGIYTSSKGERIVLQRNTYDLVNNLLTSVDGNGNKTEYTINSLGKVKTQKLPGDESIGEENYTYQYDSNENLALKESSSGRKESYKYNGEGKILSKSITHPNEKENIEEFYDYNSYGDVISLKDGSSNITENTYDLRGNKIKENLNGKLQGRWEYDSLNNLIFEWDKFGNKTSKNYDEYGRVRSVVNSFGLTTEKNEYNRSGYLISKADGLNNITKYDYDDNNRVRLLTDAEGHTTEKCYDELGNIIESIDGNKNSTKYEYDGLGRLKSVLNILSERTIYSYDNNGNRTGITDGKGNITNYVYNVANNLSEIIAPNEGILIGKVQSYTYNADGSIKNIKDRNENVKSYEYDGFGRKIKEKNGDDTTSYTYDLVGNITSVSDPVNKTSYQYDSQNRVTKKTVDNNGTLKYEYDIQIEPKAGPGMARQYYHQEKITDPSNKTITKTYDGTNKLVSVEDGKDKIKYNYNANGTLKETVFPDQSIEGYSYNKDMTIKNMGHKDSSGKVEWSCSYEYDNNKNVTFFGSTEGSKSYGYDKVNRLKYQFESDGARTEYTYDKAGNRETETITKDSKSNTNNYEYDKENRLIKKIDRSTDKTLETSFIYDSNGNLIYQDTSAQNTNEVYNKRNLVYDNYNRLVQVKENDILLETNKYNYEGLRVQKETEGKTTKYLYDGTDVLMELDSNSNVNARNVYGKKLISREVGDEKGYYRYNGHGDVIGVKDNNNEELASYNYDDFGNLTEESGSFDNPYRYAGYVYDKEVNYYYLQSRMYDPVEGRFVQEDSYRGDTNNPLSLNLYTYCENNPLIYNDPNGHWPQWITNGVNWVKEKTNAAVSWVKDKYSSIKNWGSSTVNTIKNKVSNIADNVVNYVKKIDIPKLVTGITSTVVGVSSLVSGIAALAMPVPGARLVGAGMIAGGIGSLSYGLSESMDSLVGVNPLKGFVVNTLGFSEGTYHLFGLASGMASMVGMEAAGPWSNSGTRTKTPQKSNNGSPKTNPKIEREPLERPVAGDNSGNLLKGLPGESVSNPRKTFVDMMEPAEAARYGSYWKQGAGSIEKVKENGKLVYKVMDGKNINTRQRLYTVPGERSIKDVKINSKTGETYIRETIFDRYGRRIGNNDYTDHGRSDIPSHTNPHYHPNPYNNPAQHGEGIPGLHPDTP
ncbi:RHS repeat-associated core domain-containing protein [Clostridium sp. LP20]|uniref:RHS repeat-associated core domain-containing protein n=1 Tax=Clostridium sp. LP20 TaxID=3418665 RepID=UPI003EE608E3